MSGSLRVTLAIGAFALALAGCFRGERLAGGTETETSLSGRILDGSGQPAAGVDVSLYPRAWDPIAREPGHPQHATTDKAGAYAFPDVDEGAYNILAEDPSRALGAVVQDVEVDSPASAARAPLPDAGLKATGIILVPWERLPDGAGRVYLKGMPFSATYAKKDPAVPGPSLSGIPEGRYTSLVAMAVSGAPPANLLQEPLDVRAGEAVVVPPYADWAHTARIVLNTSPSGADIASDVVQYPLLVRLTAADFDFSAARSDGADVRFSKSDGTPLPYQIERWDSAAGQAALWVRLDTVYGGRSDQAILLHYGNPGAADKSDGPSVFAPAGGFAGVWHMGDTAAGAVAASRKDASGLGRNGVNRTTIPDSAGAIGASAFFDGEGGFIDLPASSIFVARDNQPLTLSCWFLAHDTSSDDSRLIDVHRSDTNGSTVALGYGKGGKAFYYSHQDKGFRTSAKPVAPGIWHHAAVTFDGKSFRLYVDGAQALGTTAGGVLAGGSYHAKIGKYGDTPTNAFRGGIDEARIANTARPPAWIKLDYESQRASQRLSRFAP